MARKASAAGPGRGGKAKRTAFAAAAARRLPLLCASLLIAGCATLTRGDERGGEVVGGSIDRKDRLAERHCRRFGRQVRVTGIVIHSAAVIFECVASTEANPD